MHFTGTIWRPPYEAHSALIQATAGCTHHRCRFCTLYEDVPFKFRMSPLSEVEADMKELSRFQRRARRVFFTGANPFVLSFDKLQALARLAKTYFPEASSLGCFARITDITPKTAEQLSALRALGFNGITIGVETGDENALAFMRKGFGAKDILAECRRLDDAGIDYHFFCLTGIYGAGRGEEGMKTTAALWNQTSPKIIVSSMLTVSPASALYQDIRQGRWEEASELEKLRELRTLIRHLDIPVYFATMGASNCVFVEGRLPHERAAMLERLEAVIRTADERTLRAYRASLRHL